MDVREVFRSLARMRASISNLEVEGMDHGIQILEDLEYVEKTWEVITAVLADAEKLEIRYETVKLWLRNLRNLAYDIEELVDLYEYQVKALDADALADAVAAAKEAMDVREVLHSLARMRASISKLEVEGMDGIQILEDLEYVQTTSWEVITAVLADAEKLEVPYETVKLWLRNLRNVAYDIEDLVDLYGYQVKALNAAAEKEEGDDGEMVMLDDDDDVEEEEEEEESSDKDINMDEEEEEEEVPSFSHSTEGEFMFVEGQGRR